MFEMLPSGGKPQTGVAQRDAVFVDFLPHTEADVSRRGRQERVFKFGSIREPGLEGFDELERAWWSWWYYRDRKRACSALRRGVNHMP